MPSNVKQLGYVVEICYHVLMNKKCSKCNLVLPIVYFYKDKTSKDGHSYWCSQCRKNNVKKHRESIEYREKQLVWNNKWRTNNKDKVLEIRRKSQNKINKLLRVVGFITPKIRTEILKRDKNTCLSCGSKNKLTIDHIEPISRGGITETDNLQTLCRSCNSRKQQKTTDYRDKNIISSSSQRLNLSFLVFCFVF